MTSQHTPGPWNLARDYYQMGSEWYVAAIDTLAPRGMGRGYTPIADVRAIDLIDELDETTGEPTYQTALANARLIAAAPDLLAALEAVIEAEDREDEGYYPALAAALELARAAVAKAQGEEAAS